MDQLLQVYENIAITEAFLENYKNYEIWKEEEKVLLSESLIKICIRILLQKMVSIWNLEWRLSFGTLP